MGILLHVLEGNSFGHPARSRSDCIAGLVAHRMATIGLAASYRVPYLDPAPSSWFLGVTAAAVTWSTASGTLRSPARFQRPSSLGHGGVHRL